MGQMARVVIWCLLAFLGVSIAVSVGITMRLNFLFTVSMVQDPEKKLLFGYGSVIADLWKACGLIFVPLLWRQRKYASSIAAASVWSLCCAWAIASLLGTVAQERMAATGGRETIHASYTDAVKELAELEARFKSLRPTRLAAEIDALLAAALARTVTIGTRTRTVDDVAKNCTRPERLTATACEEIAAFRVEIATAVEANRLDSRIAETRKRVATLRDQGATLASDTQGEMISRVTRGLLSISDAAFGLPLLVTAVFEAIGALCPVILFAAVEPMWAASGRVQTRPQTPGGRRSAPHGLVVDFLDDCTEPEETGAALAAKDLHAAYAKWCAQNALSGMAEDEFVKEFDRERERPEMRGRVRKLGDRYVGVGLVKGHLGPANTQSPSAK